MHAHSSLEIWLFLFFDAINSSPFLLLLQLLLVLVLLLLHPRLLDFLFVCVRPSVLCVYSFLAFALVVFLGGRGVKILFLFLFLFLLYFSSW